MAFLDSICLCLFHTNSSISVFLCLYPSPFDPHLKPFLLCVQWRQEIGVVVRLERREREREKEREREREREKERG